MIDELPATTGELEWGGNSNEETVLLETGLASEVCWFTSWNAEMHYDMEWNVLTLRNSNNQTNYCLLKDTKISIKYPQARMLFFWYQYKHGYCTTKIFV